MKKNINIILILAVSGLWGTVIFKYIKQFFQDEKADLSLTATSNIILPKEVKRDTFHLVALPVDPFLKKAYTPQPPTQHMVVTQKINRQPKKVSPTPVIKEVTPFPEIHYYGFIKSKDKTEELILIKVNNTLYKTRPNADCQGVVIKKIYRDSIEVKFEKQKAVIHKQ